MSRAATSTTVERPAAASVAAFTPTFGELLESEDPELLARAVHDLLDRDAFEPEQLACLRAGVLVHEAQHHPAALIAVQATCSRRMRFGEPAHCVVYMACGDYEEEHG